MKIFQSNTTVIEDAATGDPTEVGVSLAKREIENTLVVADGQTVVIGGLLSEEYTEEFADPYGAAARGYVDDIIDPRDTRPRLIDALRTLVTKRDRNPAKKHGNIPL